MTSNQEMSSVFHERLLATMRVRLDTPSFRHAARGLSGTLYLHDETSGMSLRFDRGVLLYAQLGQDLRSIDFRVGGVASDWRRFLSGDSDIFEATDGRKGGLELDADYIEVAGNAKALTEIWSALKDGTRT